MKATKQIAELRKEIGEFPMQAIHCEEAVKEIASRTHTSIQMKMNLLHLVQIVISPSRIVSQRRVEEPPYHQVDLCLRREENPSFFENQLDRAGASVMWMSPSSPIGTMRLI
jgi:hypothetical protein